MDSLQFMNASFDKFLSNLSTLLISRSYFNSRDGDKTWMWQCGEHGGSKFK